MLRLSLAFSKAALFLIFLRRIFLKGSKVLIEFIVVSEENFTL